MNSKSKAPNCPCDGEVVLNVVNGNEFWYCRGCKQEVYNIELEDLNDIFQNEFPDDDYPAQNYYNTRRSLASWGMKSEIVFTDAIIKWKTTYYPDGNNSAPSSAPAPGCF